MATERQVGKKVHSESSLRNSIKRRLVQVRTITTPTDCNALVINSSFVMAKEITLAITLKMPHCSIMYAPGIAVAKWLIKRRKIDLIVSSPMLPDGGIEDLIPLCEELSPPPDLVVVGNIDSAELKYAEEFGQLHNSVHYFGEGFRKVKSPVEVVPKQEMAVKKLGADIRNDINNPLQEIVALIYVAKAGRELAPVTVEALEAIDRAAKGIASTVKGIEDRIRTLNE